MHAQNNCTAPRTAQRTGPTHSVICHEVAREIFFTAVA